MVSKSKILVIGLADSVVEASKTAQWGDDFNVVDYDLVILHLATLTKDILNEINIKDDKYFEKIRVGLKDSQIIRGIQIVVILAPNIRSDNIPGSSIGNYDWSPIIPKLDKVAQAREINRESSKLAPKYTPLIQGYNLVLNGWKKNTGYNNLEHPYKLDVNLKELLTNKNNDSIAFSLQWTVYNYSAIEIDSQNPIVFYLPLEESEHLEGIQVIIEYYSKASGSEDPPPQWIKDVVLPSEQDKKDKIAAIIGDIKILDKARDIESDSLAKLQSIKKLLYASGSILEDAVYEALNILNIQIALPEKKFKEDCLLIDGAIQIPIEIRGVSRGMNETDLHQLTKRFLDQKAVHQEGLRGIFIFNHFREKDPVSRNEAFHHNILEQASAYSVCLIDCVTLFELVKDQMSGKKIEDLKDQILKTKGKFEPATNPSFPKTDQAKG